MMKRMTAVLLLFLTASVAASVAVAADLHDAKSQGLVGERADGFLGLVGASAPADVVALVEEVNGKRRAEYQRIARTNDLTLEQVQALAGKKAIDRTEPGDWVMLNGGWQQK